MCACGGCGTPLPLHSVGAAAAGAAEGCGGGGGCGDGGRVGCGGGGSALLAPVRVAIATAAVLFMATMVMVLLVAGPARPLLAARFSPLAPGNRMGGWTVTGASMGDAAAAAVATPGVRPTSSPPSLARSGARHHSNSAAEACAVAASALLTPDHGKRFWGEGGSSDLKKKLSTFRAQLAATDGQSVIGEAATAAATATTTTSTATPSATHAAAVTTTTAAGVSHRARPVVVDVGANEGQSFAAWRRAYAAPRIYAVEGNPDTADRLAVALAREGVVDADAAESLVGNTTREATFRRSRKAVESQTSGLWPDGAPQRDGHKFDYIKIRVDTLDNILKAATSGLPPSQQLPWPPSGTPSARTYPIDLLKIDVEGYDVAAMTAAPFTLSASRLVLWECHALMQAAEGGPGTTHAAAAAMLAVLGFESYKLGRDSTLLRFDGDWADPTLDEPLYMGWHNCLAIRRDDPLRVPLLRSLSKNIKDCEWPWGLQEATGDTKR
ncbi:hypothetical protein MMPV_009573 [Pyropia vietnamensis]